MANLLLLVSILLNGIALFCIVILYLRQNRFLQVEKKHEKLLSEMEEVISTYLLEMTEENEKFIHKVKELIPKQASTNDAQSARGTSFSEGRNEHEVGHETIEPEIKSIKEKGSIKPVIEESDIEKDKREQPTFRKGTVFQAVQAYKQTTNMDDPSRANESPIIQSVPEPPAEKSIPSNAQPPNRNQDQSTNDLYAQSFYYQALLLQKQGLSTEEIAKRLNKGTTEIELLLKLRQKT